MTILCPTSELIPGLRRLWQAAFGDSDSFLDRFFALAYAPDRCRCITEDGQVLAALYWFDTQCEGQHLAYLYAVATDPAHRNRGLCRKLIADTLSHLKAAGFHGALLVPENDALARMYEAMGFEACTTVSEFHCSPGPYPAPIHAVDTAEYARLRRDLLPAQSVLQEGADLALLAADARFYAGPHCLAAVSADGETLHCHELLGGADTAPAILRALGYDHGFFRLPGPGKPFACLCPLTEDCIRPNYFGLALD